jgi:hypothetical protein
MRRPIIRLSLIAVLLIGVSSCRSCTPTLPEARDSDAGDYSFVRQAIPKLAGRKARGYAEVKVLADLITQSNRPTVLRAMLKQQDFQREYIEHWSENAVDFMRAHRETGKQQTGSGQCFGPSLRTPVDYSTALSEFVRDNAPTATTVPGGDYNFSDLLRSSFALDNLSPAYRTYLFAMVNRPITGNETTEQNRRDDLGATFTRVYTHRQMTCLACHTTTNSTTGHQTFWNRHFPIRGQFATALFGAATGRPADEVHAMLRTDVAGGGSRPWGIRNCGTFVAQASVPNDLLTAPSGAPLEAYFTSAQGRRGSVWQLENTLRTGYDNLAANGLRRTRPTGGSGARCGYCSGSSTCPGGPTTPVPPLDAAGLARESDALGVLQTSCFSCHASGSGGLQMDSTNFKSRLIGMNSLRSSTQLLVAPGDAAASYLMAKLDSSSDPLADGTRRMPFGGGQLPATERNKIRAWINGLSLAAGCASCTANVCETDHLEGNAAFAFLTAGRVVENTWDEVVGAPLTLPNYFPRNAAQRDVLWTLTETQFVPSQWSMQRLLTRIMTTDFFNRLPPAQSTGPSAYELPPFIDPWVVGDPRLPPIGLPGTPPGSGSAPTPDPSYDQNTESNRPRHLNSMSDGVHRYSPRSLLQSVHKALGWPAPKREASSSYPDDNLRKSIGQFYRDAEPGFREVGFQGLLTWEQAHGRCNKPPNQTGDDWIDLLVTAIPGFNTSNPTNRALLRDVVLAMKDRLLADASIQTTTPTDVTQTEAAAFAALFGIALTAEPDLSTTAATNAFKQKARDSCGILLETPQFMLAGIAPTQLGELPRLQVCLPGEPCGYRAVCESYVTPMSGLGYIVTCGDDSLTVSLKPANPSGRLPDFCPESRCGIVPRDLPDMELCLVEPQKCFREPPPCDPRCARIDCCGGPLPPIEGRELFLFWADKGRVTNANGVQVLRPEKGAFEPLAAGAELRTGEILVLNAESQLEINTPEGGFRTPKEGLGLRGEQKYWFVQITGPQALAPQQRDQYVLSVPNEVGLEISNKAYWLARGEAGLPTVPNQRKEPSDLPGRAKRPPLTPMRPTWEQIGPLNRQRQP